MACKGSLLNGVGLRGPAAAWLLSYSSFPPGMCGLEGSERALPEHMRTLQALLPRPQHLKHAPVPLGFIVEVRRLLCRAIPAREALKTYHLSAQDVGSLPICKVCCCSHS